MKVVHVNTWEGGGAAKACIRLHEALLKQGVDSALLTLGKPSGVIPQHHHYFEDKSIYTRSFSGRVWEKISGSAKRELQESTRVKAQRKSVVDTVRRHFEHFSFPDSKYRQIGDHPLIRQADIINLHWVSDFLDFASFFKASADKKIVWTLHDMNAFTGGCHYSAGCHRHREACQNCPQISDSDLPDQAEISLALKMKVLDKSNGLKAIVTPSRWLSSCSSASKLFKHLPHFTIPYSLPTEIFTPLDKDACRQVLSLPRDKKILLFVSTQVDNNRKGFDLLLKSLEKLGVYRNLVVCSVGEAGARLPALEPEHISLGKVQDERLMSVVYNAADAFIIPSREDNLPNVVLESLTCGTPVIGFAVGGILDMVQSGSNGLLVEKTEPRDLAIALDGFLNGTFIFNREAIAAAARTKYSPEVQAGTYMSLYQSLLVK
jgi:glycosyltransferase involved in cell wall biosynthesis